MDVLWNSLDNDSSGGICYHEFIRKLERFGVANRSQDETVIYQMMEAAKRAKMNMANLFEMIDKRGNGIISQTEFEDVFRNLNLTVDAKTLESFINNFWKDNKAGIDYK
jgi:Ca2+-binding EF-hand superfamily protein